MVELLVSWIYILINVIIWGGMFCKMIQKVTGYLIEELDMILVTGMVMLTTYAQFFSIFYRVSLLANIFMIAIDIIFLLFIYKDIVRLIKKYICREQIFYIFFVLCIAIIVASASAGVNQHYDTELYHGQAIRWIEEYGVVKGLGNLMNNFAYNSSFFSLQALFSLKFLLGRSLRNLNGFIVFIMDAYAITTMSIVRTKRFKASDLLKLMLVIISFSTNYYSSASSDIMTMLVVAYIFVKWFCYLKSKEETTIPMSVLCLFGAFALTLKLSAGIIILAMIQPVVVFVKKKQWKYIVFFLISGIIIIVPYLIRNVIISGYLLYPYASLDLFNVDWKMNKDEVKADALQIMVWGKNMQEYGIKSYPFLTWFPIWFFAQNIFIRILIVFDIIVIPFSVLLELLLKIKRKTGEFLVFFLTSGFGFWTWLLTAPLLRYGKTWTLINAFVFAGILMEIIYTKLAKSKCGYILRRVQMWCVTIILLICLKNNILAVVTNQYRLIQADYATIACVPNDIDGVTIYTPEDGDQAGYQYFPTTANVNKFETLGLRTGKLKDGFYNKVKE